MPSEAFERARKQTYSAEEVDILLGLKLDIEAALLAFQDYYDADEVDNLLDDKSDSNHVHVNNFTAYWDGPPDTVIDDFDLVDGGGLDLDPGFYRLITASEAYTDAGYSGAEAPLRSYVVPFFGVGVTSAGGVRINGGEITAAKWDFGFKVERRNISDGSSPGNLAITQIEYMPFYK